VKDEKDWFAWHHQYDEPTSRLAQRLEIVRSRVRIVLDEAPPGPLRVISAVAGQGRDLLPVLATHPRAADVTARLVELDPRNTAVARSLDSGPAAVEIVTGDASLVDGYAGLAPADLVLLCGLFGNITGEDIRHTILTTRALTRAGGTVIWTRRRDENDATDFIRDVFAEHGFEFVWLSEPSVGFGVGVHRYRDEPDPLPAGERMFTFVGRSELRARGL
jgi:hypothetical protein